MKTKAFIALLVIFILSLPFAASASVCPTVAKLNLFSTGRADFMPLKVAVDSRGNTYVTDNFNDQVHVFDHKGSLKKTLRILGPSGIAVEGGKVYIGRSNNNRGFHNGEVIVYDENFNELYKLGKGWGEFQRPYDIRIDGDRVYVADDKTSLVSAYSSTDGSFISSFGGFGYTEGTLAAPKGVDVYSGVMALEIISTSMPDGEAASAYSYPVVAGGGTQPYSWSVVGGALPDGLSINAQTGEVSGTPTTEGTYPFTVQVADAGSATAQTALSITILSAPAPDPWSDNFDDGVIGSQWAIINKLGNDFTNESAGVLNININNTGTVTDWSGIETVGLISGDFDLQIDFLNFTYVATNYAQLFFEFKIDDGSFVRLYRGEPNYGTQGVWGLVLLNGGGTIKTAAYSKTSGKFRIKRQGTNISLYYYDNGWIEINNELNYSQADGKIRIFAQAAASNVINVDLDNLKNNLSGSALTPPPPPPVSISGDRVYIADLAMQYSSGDDGLGNQPGWALGAAGEIFTKDGVFIKRFGQYGYANLTGMMVSPRDIVIDSQDRVIIPDYFYGDLNVYDIDGAPLCDIGFGAYSLEPQSAVFTEGGKLVMAVDGNISVLGLDGYVGLSVSPPSLSFDSAQCGSGAGDQQITITNEGPGVLNWSISFDSAWLTPSVASGEINGMASVNVGIGVDATGLAAGAYNGNLTINAQGAQEKVGVALSVPEPLSISVTPQSFTFDVAGTTMPPAQTLTVSAEGQGSVTWSASSDQGWVGVSPSSGSTDTTYVDNVSINQAGLDGIPGGTHNATITVSSSCAANGPIAVPVVLNYIKGGTIQVTTNYDGASFTLSGPATYTGGGLSASFEGAQEGIYTITFGKSQGLIEPASYSQSVLNGGTAAFTGNYIDLRKRNNIIATAGVAGYSVPDELRIFDADGIQQGSIALSPADPLLTGLRPETNTAVGDVDGDGSEDIVVGHDRGVITGYNADGSPIAGLEFRAFPFYSNVELKVADFDGDGRGEIAVSAGNKAGDQPIIRVFSFDGTSVVDTGVNLAAYQKKKGVNVSAGDVDGDGRNEMLTVQSGPGNARMEVRIWKIDTSGGPGSWAAVDAGSFLAGQNDADADITAGDLDADGVDEIIVCAFDSSALVTNVYASGPDGAPSVSFSAPSAEGGDVVAAGDIDFDGNAEIVVGDTKAAAGVTSIRIFNADGTYRGEFPAFADPDITGVRVSLGQLMGQ